ncbi:hypothetical protein KVG88_06275 [Pseudomonas sp. SWRI74]|uniref:Uncharacterized protein n=1 Tax=Pseudomonas azerbaijanoccidentalis TaxID=2842347 RepID=A0ABS6QL44_9PSED|nr:hypothetical protein [Pseudomonas azerbaijanoccidentalis]MBV4519663.1 hypothetical protein [Pseudomonas azerbaijanoccidentalis]
MKILLTAFLWIASPIVFGATSVPHITNEGCKVNLEKFASISSASWSGKCRDGAVDGIGVMSLTGASGTLKLIQEYYDGEWASSQYFLDSNSIVQAQRQGQVITIKACKLSADCDLLYQTAIKSGLLKKANNSGLTGVVRFFDDRTIGEEALAKLESNFSAGGPNTAKANKSNGAIGTADGLDFRLQNGYIVATGGPCTAPGLYKVSVGEGAFKEVKDGTFRNNYYLDGVMRSNRGFDIHTMLSPNVNWSETVRQNRSEASNLPLGHEAKVDAEKEADVVECLARSQTQYAIAFENWMKANMHLCKICKPEPNKPDQQYKKPANAAICPKTVTVKDNINGGPWTDFQWELDAEIKNDQKKLATLLEQLKDTRDCNGCGSSFSEYFHTTVGEYPGLYLLSDYDLRDPAKSHWQFQQKSTHPFIKMVSCELGIVSE